MHLCKQWHQNARQWIHSTIRYCIRLVLKISSHTDTTIVLLPNMIWIFYTRKIPNCPHCKHPFKNLSNHIWVTILLKVFVKRLLQGLQQPGVSPHPPIPMDCNNPFQWTYWKTKIHVCHHPRKQGPWTLVHTVALRLTYAILALIQFPFRLQTHSWIMFWIH